MYVDDVKEAVPVDDLQAQHLESINQTVRYMKATTERLLAHSEASGSDDVLSRVKMLRAALNAVLAAPELQAVEAKRVRENSVVAQVMGR